MSKRTGRKPKRERTSRRRTRRHSSTSETSSEDVPSKTTRVSSRVDDAERKVALTIKLPKPDTNDCSEENTTGMWKVECSNGSDGDIQKLKISLRRSPKDLLREQAAEEKRKEKETASCSTNSSLLDGSVTSYLEQFGSAIANEEIEQSTVDSNEQVQVVIPANEPLYKEDSTSQIDKDDIDSSETPSKTLKEHEEPIVENISIDNKSIYDTVCETTVEANEILNEDINETIVAVESINQFTTSENISDFAVHLPVEELKIEASTSEENSVYVAEVVASDVVKIVSSDVVETVSSDVDIPLVLSENVKDVQPESIENVVDLNTSKVVEENVPIVEINKIANDSIEVSNKADVINDSEQMEDVVQLTVESPDLVDDEDPKPVDEEEPKLVYGEKHIILTSEEPKLDNEEHKPVGEEETKPIEESYLSLSSDVPDSKQIDVEKELKLNETHPSFEIPKSTSSHPKRKWGSCKTRTPITISPFTLGTIIESNGDSFGDNGEYRSEEGEIQRTDSDEEEQYVEDTMEINDTMLIDHEAVDYEAPEEEEKPDIDNDDSKSDKTLPEEVVNVEPKKKSSVKRVATTNVIRITNLVRPFTVGQLRDLLQRTGKIVSNGFWIDTIKSQCIVEYENEDQAIETVYALNESQWPSTNPKFLRVVFTDKEELNKALNGTHPDRLVKQKDTKVEKLSRTQVENHIILREWDRGKLEDINGEKDDKSIKRKISVDLHVAKTKKLKKDEKEEKEVSDKRRKSKSKTSERMPIKSLDELFRKTKTTPTLYWSPLSSEQIAEKEDQRRKHLAEMVRSQKTDRRRREINNFPRRR